ISLRRLGPGPAMCPYTALLRSGAIELDRVERGVELSGLPQRQRRGWRAQRHVVLQQHGADLGADLYLLCDRNGHGRHEAEEHDQSRKDTERAASHLVQSYRVEE